MADKVEHADLRALTRPVVAGLKDRFTHEEISDVCRRLGLPIPFPGRP